MNYAIGSSVRTLRGFGEPNPEEVSESKPYEVSESNALLGMLPRGSSHQNPEKFRSQNPEEVSESDRI